MGGLLYSKENSRIEDRHRQYTGLLYEKECQVCGDTFRCHGHWAKYCSQRCKNDAQMYFRKLRQEQKKTVKLCSICENEFQAKRKDQKFCSNACRQKHHRVTHKGFILNNKTKKRNGKKVNRATNKTEKGFRYVDTTLKPFHCTVEAAKGVPGGISVSSVYKSKVIQQKGTPEIMEQLEKQEITVNMAYQLTILQLNSNKLKYNNLKNRT